MRFTAVAVERIIFAEGGGEEGKRERLVSRFRVIYIVRQWIPMSRIRLPFSWLSMLSLYFTGFSVSEC